MCHTVLASSDDLTLYFSSLHTSKVAVYALSKLARLCCCWGNSTGHAVCRSQSKIILLPFDRWNFTMGIRNVCMFSSFLFVFFFLHLHTPVTGLRLRSIELSICKLTFCSGRSRKEKDFTHVMVSQVPCSCMQYCTCVYFFRLNFKFKSDSGGGIPLFPRRFAIDMLVLSNEVNEHRIHFLMTCWRWFSSLGNVDDNKLQ